MLLNKFLSYSKNKYEWKLDMDKYVKCVEYDKRVNIVKRVTCVKCAESVMSVNRVKCVECVKCAECVRYGNCVECAERVMRV